MHRPARMTLAAALTCVAAATLAQGGGLSSVTMRVLDDVSGVDAVVRAFEANGGEGREPAEHAAAAEAGDPGRESAATSVEGERGDLRRERDAQHDRADDERGEGRPEGHDVERPAVPPGEVP